MNSMIRNRCLAHVLRSRVLGLRFSSTATHSSPTAQHDAPPTPAAQAPRQPTRHKEEPVEAKQKAPVPEIALPKPLELQRYKISSPPTTAQATYTNRYFSNPSAPPLYLWTSAKFAEVPRSPYPEVCFVGRSNVGKSSLLNAVFGRPKEKIARVSSKAGHTKTLNAFGIGGSTRDTAAKEPLKQLGSGSLIVVDTPGYGHNSRKEWGPEINKFFLKRKQLRKVFVLIDAVHGMKTRDLTLLQHFEEHGIPYQVVLSKVDNIVMTDSRSPSPEKLRSKMKKLDKAIAGVEKDFRYLDQGRRDKDRDILVASAEKEIKMKGWPNIKIGVDAVRWAVLKACGLECEEDGSRRVVEGIEVLKDED